MKHFVIIAIVMIKYGFHISTFFVPVTHQITFLYILQQVGEIWITFLLHSDMTTFRRTGIKLISPDEPKHFRHCVS
jgi:hypothetical protein